MLAKSHVLSGKTTLASGYLFMLLSLVGPALSATPGGTATTPGVAQPTAALPWTPTDDFLPSEHVSNWVHLGPGDGFGYQRSDVFFDQAEVPRNSAGWVRVTFLLKWSKDSNVSAGGKRINNGMVVADINCKSQEWRWLREVYALENTRVWEKPLDTAAVEKIAWANMNQKSGWSWPTFSERALKAFCYWNPSAKAFDLMPQSQRDAALYAEQVASYNAGLQRASGYKCDHIDQLQQAGTITNEQAQAQKERLSCN